MNHVGISFLLPFFVLVTAIGLDLLLQFAARRMLSRRSVKIELISFSSFLAAGFVAMVFFSRRFMTSGEFNFSLLLGSFGFYFSGLIVYLQSRSFFSRGYSIRILLDLASRDGKDTVSHLMKTYGGIGIEGMLMKRIQSMAALKLIAVSRENLGPPTRMGFVLGQMAAAYRRLLKLENVG